jgi:hypothetical protein
MTRDEHEHDDTVTIMRERQRREKGFLPVLLITALHCTALHCLLPK